MGPKDFSKVTTFKIFLSNLPNGLKNEDVSKLFEPYGRVVECEVFKTNYAFVHMEDDPNCRNAISEMHGKEIEGNVISVVQSKNVTGPKIPVMKLAVGNIPSSIKATDLRELFRKYGFVLEAQVKGNQGHVLLEATGDIRSAINDVNGLDVEGQQLKVEAVTNFNGFPSTNPSNVKPAGKRKEPPQHGFGGRPQGPRPKFGGAPPFQGPPQRGGPMRGPYFPPQQNQSFPGYNNYDYDYDNGPPGLGYYNNNNYDDNYGNDFSSDDQPPYYSGPRRPPMHQQQFYDDYEAPPNRNPNFFRPGTPARIARDRSMNFGSPQQFYSDSEGMNNEQDEFYDDSNNFNQVNHRQRKFNQGGGGGPPMKKNRQQKKPQQQQQPRPLMGIDAAGGPPAPANINSLMKRTAKMTKFGKIVVNGGGGGVGVGSGVVSGGPNKKRGVRGGTREKARKAGMSMEARINNLLEESIPGVIRPLGGEPVTVGNPPQSNNNPNNNKGRGGNRGRGRGGGGGGMRPQSLMNMRPGPPSLMQFRAPRPPHPQNFNQPMRPMRPQQQRMPSHMGGGNSNPPKSLLALHHENKKTQQQTPNQIPNQGPKMDIDFTADIDF